MKWDDDVLEEDNVFVSEWDSESTDNTCKNIQKLSGTIELVSLMDKEMETLINSLSNHLPSWDEFSIKFMKNIL